eukprot:12153539-Prorocentrum_lima.AAC.1
MPLDLLGRHRPMSNGQEGNVLSGPPQSFPLHVCGLEAEHLLQQRRRARLADPSFRLPLGFVLVQQGD